ncbi:MAG: Stf0 family sulfotransferase [Nocardioides sp.]
MTAGYASLVASGSGYVLCGTPRTGSTLLCGLLSSTGVLGRPESYFREPDERAWAERLGVPVVGERAVSYSRFARAVQAAGSTDNNVSRRESGGVRSAGLWTA